MVPGGDLVSKRKQSMKLVVTTNGEKSAEVIVTERVGEAFKDGMKLKI